EVEEEEEYIHDEGALAEIDPFVLSHTSQLHSVEFRCHAISKDLPSSIIQEEN
ncbi:hypothetical protein HMI54_013967, partial [Coelomomyces lativittatus]